ncbi:hypothetical protein LPB90_20170 [Chryseobacterium sp. LC2016-29]|uniref:hypothetical protein n=1 Tax=Chryseobacterium sp. LC2016-29 TaxID=2897331 RepID=UPI001E2C4A25|nr:hypothetical protein [Chryseobacterium sp. LC2016-29]MCD0480766.1 hypothetical protein [Chryseobacterium sp. LC2016-29]
MFVLAKAYKNGLIKDMNTFVVGVVTASGTQYLMVIDDPVKFTSFADNLFVGSDFDNVVVKNYEDAYQFIYKITPTNSASANEKSFYNYLEANGTGLKVLKGDANFNNWGVLTKDSSGNVTPQDCQ